MAGYERQEQTETVVYRPAAGGTRSVQALVERPGRQRQDGLPPVPTFAVTVLNDATVGVTPAEVNSGGDTIDLAEFPGGTGVARQVLDARADDANWTTLTAS